MGKNGIKKQVLGDFFGCFVFVSQTNKKENAIKVETTRERALLRARAHTRRGRKREKRKEREDNRVRAHSRCIILHKTHT